jgi:hypothetical protein
MKVIRFAVVSHVALALALGCHDGQRPGSAEPNTVVQPVVNGTREPQTVPLSDGQIMALGWLYPPGTPEEVICTGTLVAPDVVVTARMCTTSASDGRIGFGIGVDPASPEALFDSSAIYAHDEVDVALIVLEEDAIASGVEINPIPLNTHDISDSAVGRAVQVGGFGETQDPETDGRLFATVTVTEVTDEEIVVDGQGEQGLCFGDSGGPVIDVDPDGSPVVLAVESWGDSSCVDVDHTVRLDPLFDDWIEPILALDRDGGDDGAGDDGGDAGPIDTSDAGDVGTVDLGDRGGVDTSGGGAAASESGADDEGCGCASASGAARPGLSLLVFLALLLGWRARQTRSPRHPRDPAG